MITLFCVTDLKNWDSAKLQKVQAVPENYFSNNCLRAALLKKRVWRRSIIDHFL
jgi:hypothetical protein